MHKKVCFCNGGYQSQYKTTSEQYTSPLRCLKSYVNIKYFLCVGFVNKAPAGPSDVTFGHIFVSGRLHLRKDCKTATPKGTFNKDPNCKFTI